MRKQTAKNTVHQCNLDLMHLLISIPDVKDVIKEIRTKYKIPEEGIEAGENLNKWNENLLTSHWEEWDKETRNIWERCKKLKNDKRYIEHIRTFVLTNTITAPEHNYVITRRYEEERLKEFGIRIYKSLAKDEKKILFKELDKLMEYSDPSLTKKHRPKWGIEESIFILENFEKMKITGDHSIVRGKNRFEGSDNAKDRNEKMHQRVKKEIEERIGWDTSGSN